MPLPSTESIEKKLLDCTAALHPQAGSEELLLRLFREQDARLRPHRPGRVLPYAALAAAACLAFCALACFEPRPSTTPSAALPPVAQVEESADTADDIDSGIPEGTIDDIMSNALANNP